jgi:deoxyhypusine synthase
MKSPHPLSESELKEKHAQFTPKECTTLEGYPKIEGYDFEKPFDLNRFLKAYSTTGFQATHLAEGIEIIKTMRREKATIFLSYTSNMVSSGVREAIKYLVKHKKVDVLITSAGGIEEDVIKTLKPFALGKFEVPGEMLFEHGVNRIGNIFVPNDRFAYFDKFMQKFLPELHEKQKKNNKIYCPHEFIRELGLAIKDEDSILYWAAKNNIPVFCPGIIDGSIGDMIYFYKQTHADFYLDVTKEIKEIVNIALNAEKTGGIILGGGISKHFALNANIFREGFDYIVYVNTAQEFDGSDSGARVEEAITWGKVKPHALNVKVYCDATVAFPLMVAGSFALEEKEK